MLGREPRRFWYLISSLVCLAVVAIALRGRLGLYIHPRYNLFTIVTTSIGFFILFVSAFQYRYKQQTVVSYESNVELAKIFGIWLLGGGAWFVLITLSLLAWAPNKPLLSTAAERKQQSATQDLDYIRQSSWFSSPSSIYQIDRVLLTPEGTEQQAGKSFNFTGFVRPARDGSSDVFLLSRFAIACCAVDATPNYIPVYLPNWQEDISVDDWVEVQGRLVTKATEISSGLILEGSVKKVQQPDEPYDYL